MCVHFHRMFMPIKLSVGIDSTISHGNSRQNYNYKNHYCLFDIAVYFVKTMRSTVVSVAMHLIGVAGFMTQ